MKIMLSVTEETKAQLAEIAKQQRRKMSEVVRYLVAKETEEMGLTITILPHPEGAQEVPVITVQP